jgi:hypothetical protein
VTNLAKAQTNVEEYSVSPAAQDGEITMQSDAESKTILVDKAHANQFTDSEIASLVNELAENGHEIKYVTEQTARGPAFNESLRKADAYLVVNPMRPYTTEQLAGVEAFADAGGRVLMLSDPASVQVSGLFALSVSEVSSKFTGLGSQFGVTVQPGYLYNMHEYQHNYKRVYATPEASSSLSDGVDRVVFHEAVAVGTADGDAALTATERTMHSATRRAQTHSVVVQSGDVAMVGDTDFLASGDVYLEDNEILVGNLADFLVSGDKEPGAPAKPGAGQPMGGTGGFGGAAPTSGSAPAGTPSP